MKFTAFLLLAACLNASAIGNAQKLSLTATGVTLKKVFREIKRQTDYTFVYTETLLKKANKISIHIKDKSLKEALDICFKDQPLTYTVLNTMVVIREKEEALQTAPESAAAVPPPVVIIGKVVDKDNVPLQGVTVLVRGTRNGTSTNADGTFSITVQDNREIVLEFSSVGYQAKAVIVGGNTQVFVTLEQDIAGLNNVVVIGYGVVRKSDVTGSVGSVSRKELNAYPVTDAVMGLQGKTSGVRVIQNSGAPGAPVTVRIRGGNSLLGGNEPLYVVDGFALTGGPNQENPNDIESIEVLKDASATAIYGSRGANGVVIITTKKGKAGRSEVSFDTYYAIQQVGKTIEMMNAREFAELANERAANDGLPAYFTPQQVSSFGDGTNWQDELFRTAPMQNHSVTATGGNENTQYSFSANYLGQTGVIESSGLRRQSLRANVIQKISSKVGVTFNATMTNSDLSQIDINGQKGGTVLSAVLVAPPTVSAYDASGAFNPVRIYPFSPNELRNPRLAGKGHP